MKYIVFLLILVGSWGSGLAQAATFAPPAGKTLLFVGQDKQNIREYIKSTESLVPAGTMVYTSLANLEGLIKPVNYGGGTQHAQWLVERYPHSSLQVGLYLVDALDGVIVGGYDKNLKKLARWLKRTNRPVYMRIGYEFDNPDNHYDSTKYQQAFRYIVQKMRKYKVNNVAFVWHAQATGEDRNYMFWYPGDAFVDWVAVSYFSPYNTENMDRLLHIARSRKKPFMIAESSAIKIDFTNATDAYNRWFRFAFEYIEKNDIEAFSYINVHWDAQKMHQDLDWGDARIQMNSELMEIWMGTVNQDRYVNASEDHFPLIHFKMNKSKIKNRYY